MPAGPLSRQGRREHTLSGDRRAGTYARRKARTSQNEYVREHWTTLLFVALAGLAIVAATATVQRNQLLRGIVVGGGSVFVGATIAFWVVQASGTAATMMGDLAEQWTSSELRKLRKGGWKHVNHLVLRQRDIDHVLVGPGGLFAIETKWSATPWTDQQPRVWSAAEAAAADARDLRLWSATSWVGAEAVTPVVFLWGGKAEVLELARFRDAPATVVVGQRAQDWLAAVSTLDTRLSPDDIARCWKALDSQASRRDALEPAMPTRRVRRCRADVVYRTRRAGRPPGCACTIPASPPRPIHRPGRCIGRRFGVCCATASAAAVHQPRLDCRDGRLPGAGGRRCNRIAHIGSAALTRLLRSPSRPYPKTWALRTSTSRRGSPKNPPIRRLTRANGRSRA